jgi:type IV secretion system protein VirB6
MGLFAQFFDWLNAMLATYVGTKTALVAAAVEPAVVTMGIIYVMVWGWMSLQGMIQEPVMDGVKRILVIGLILGIGINLWAYNTLITDTFFNAPDQLAAAIVGAPTTIDAIDHVWFSGNLVAEELLKKGSVLSGDFAYYLAGFGVYFVVGVTVTFTAFLFALSKVAIAVILSLGPIFIGLLFFDATKRFFESWIAQLANYALITVLAMMTTALMLTIVVAYANDAAARGGAITIAESVRLCAAAGLVFLVMLQVMPIASGLASGIALSSFGAVNVALGWTLGSAKRTGYQFGRGVVDGWSGSAISRHDTLRRSAGNLVGSGLGSLRDQVTSGTGGNVKYVPRERIMPRRNQNL